MDVLDELRPETAQQTPDDPQADAVGDDVATGAEEQLAEEESDAKLTEAQRIAAEALAAAGPAEETPDKDLEGIKREKSHVLHELTGLRAEMRKWKQEQAEREAAEKAAQAVPEDISPIEKFVAENPDEELVPAAVQAAQIKWDRQRQAARRKAASEQEQASRVEALKAKGISQAQKSRQTLLLYDEITQAAESLLTERDVRHAIAEIEAGEDGTKWLYHTAVGKLRAHGGKQAKELLARLEKMAKPKAKTSAKKQTEEPGGLEEEEPAEDEKPASSRRGYDPAVQAEIVFGRPT